MLTHWLQIHLHKLIPDRARKEARWEARKRRRHKVKKGRRRQRRWESAEVGERKERETKRVGSEGKIELLKQVLIRGGKEKN